MATATSTTDETRLCEICCLRLPISQFRWRTKHGGRDRRCRRCHYLVYEKGRRARQRMRKRDQAVSQFVLQVNRARTDHRVMALVNEMVAHFGGLSDFAEAWKDQIDRVREARPMGKKALDFFRAVTRLIEATDVPEADIHSLSDEELADQLLASTERLVVEHPELVLRVAEALGWTVVPPESVALDHPATHA